MNLEVCMKSLILEEKINFIDRDDEVDEIINDISFSSHNRVRIVYAKTAIGKSSLVSKVLSQESISDYEIIRIKTYPQNTNRNVNDWLYLDLIFEAISKYFDKSEYNYLKFEYYIANTKNRALRKEMLENISDQIVKSNSKHKILSIFTYYFIKRILKIGEFNFYKIVQDNTMFSRMIKTHYINYVLSNIKILLSIDNIQNIDNISLKYFVDWLNDTNSMGHYFILEYTVSDDHPLSELNELSDLFKESGATVIKSELDKIPSEYVVDIINKHFPDKPNNINFNIDVLKYYRSTANGNIRELLDYTICYDNISNNNNVHPTFMNIYNLSEHSQYILSIIVYNHGSILTTLLAAILQISPADLDTMLTELYTNNIIQKDDNNVKILHSTIIDQWNNNIQSFKDIDKLAYKQLEKYYKECLYNESTDIPIDIAWQMLLQIYVRNEPTKISTLLKNLEQGIISNISPQGAWNYLSKLINATKHNVKYYEDLYFHILQMCFEFELYTEGFSCIQIMDNSQLLKGNTKLLLYRSMYYSALDKHKENIQLYEDSIHKFAMNSREYLNLSLIVLCSYKSLNIIDQCIKIHNEFIHNKTIMQYPEYAYFLRLTNIYLPDYISIRYVTKSVKLFYNSDNVLQAGKSMITQAKLLAGLGKYHSAIKKIQKAETLLASKRIGAHMIYVNYAAFLLLNGSSDLFVWNLLDRSECSAVVPYDKLAIIVNKLVWCFENKQYNKIPYLESQAKKLIPAEPDEHVHVLIYYNLYLIYKNMADHKTAEHYYQMAYHMRNKCAYVKARIEKIHNRDVKHRLKKPWHVCFLSYWTYDLY